MMGKMFGLWLFTMIFYVVAQAQAVRLQLAHLPESAPAMRLPI